MATYEQALVTLNYSTNCPDPQDLISETLEPTAEYVTLDYESFGWSSSPGTMLYPNEAPSRLTKGLNYVVTFHHLLSIPDGFLSLIGCCNARPVRAKTLGLTFQAETLLFNPPTLSRKITTTEVQAWQASCRFTYKPNGWNKFWRAETDAWEQVVYLGKSTAMKIYPPSDFSAIFG